MKISKLNPCVLTIIFIFTVMSASKALAANNVLGLDDNERFDIFIGTADNNFWVIKDVRVIDFRDIKNVLFLVIQSDTFNAKASEGLILLSSIQAIIPTNKFIQYQPGFIYKK